MANLSDMTVTVELTDKAQTQLDYMLVQIEGIRAEIASCEETRRKLAYTEEKLGALNATNAWQGHQLLLLQKERAEYKLQRDTWQRSAFDAEVQLERVRKGTAATVGDNFRRCAEENAELRAWKAAIPWASMWAYFTHGDYGPGTWREVDEWLRKNMPREMARERLEVPEVQP
jgi:hypothetical protein